MDLGRDDPELFIPHATYAGVLARNRVSLIGRLLNPRELCPVQIRGIPLPYISEETVKFISKTLGEFVELDFNEETTSQISFIRVKIAIGITDRLRFSRRVCFESGEGALIGFEYEKLKQICTNCSRINHDSSHCPYLVPPVYQEDVPNVPVTPAFEEGEGSNIYSFLDEKHSSLSSEISSYSPISQPPRPAAPGPNMEEFLAAYPIGTRLSSSSDFRGVSSMAREDTKEKDKAKFERGECSKRRKGKQVQVENERNTRQRRKDPGIRFYLTEHEAP
ncbi:PREDICTED: uncharacterized protein At4g02000-like [Camelina sativa]|uniref:Uncharacterized protein At4g02000-like n=1 Tax=Camelina sativa TaxID=90675 RepID=A0ABM0WPD7_CAMSA|nr:PREDICTED: uncharacterized protein At4g02000-like [Camelina sativa]